MRVLFWSSTFPPAIGGVQTLAAKLLPALEERGYDFLVVTPKSGFDEPNITHYKGIPVHHFPFWSSMVRIEKLAQIRQHVANLKRTFAPDLIHINAVGRSDFFHHLTFQAHPTPLLVTLHGGWLPEADQIVRRTLLSANWVVGCSETALDNGRQLVPKIGSLSSVILNALPEPPLSPAQLSFDPPQLLCLGRLVEDKGFDLALIALSSLVGRFPQMRLIIAGEGPARTDLERQGSKLGILNAVQFTGPVEPEMVPRLLNTATVVVMPSRWEEPFGLVALEAALMARPIVASRVGGLAEVIAHNQTGILVEKENGQALAASIAFLLEHPTTATQMGQAGRIRALEHFSWNQYVNGYDALYQRLIAHWKTETDLSAGFPKSLRTEKAPSSIS